MAQRPPDPPQAGSAPPPAAPPRGSERPDYKVYRSSGPLSGLRLGDRLRFRRARRGGRPGDGEGRRITPGRVVKIVLALVVGWILLSAVLFMVSAQTTRGVTDRAEKALSGEGSLLTGSTILVLGSDERSEETKEELEALGQDPGEGGRADSILLLHVGFGNVQRLSILRDSFADIPGHDSQKINAAYFLGGPNLMIRTVEDFLGNGLQIDHLIEVRLEQFPELIDALGGVDVTTENDICADGFDLAGEGFELEAGEHHLNGDDALSFARVRSNPCAPEEDDRARAARQQEVFSAIRSQVLSPSTFIRLPWASWEAPRAIRTDLKGPGLAMLFTDLLTGGTGETRVLEPSGPANSDGSLPISEEARAQAVDELLGR
jgi:LCP family protein required for cell wall assembly